MARPITGLPDKGVRLPTCGAGFDSSCGLNCVRLRVWNVLSSYEYSVSGCSVFMRCCNVKCSEKAKILLQSLKDGLLTVEVTGRPQCEPEDVLAAIHNASTAARTGVSEALKRGEGPTEAFENVAEATNDIFLTKAGVRTQAAREKRKALVPASWPRDVMQYLLIMRQVQREEIPLLNLALVTFR